MGGGGLSSASSPALSPGPIAVQAETLVPGTSPGMTLFAAISHYVSAHGDKSGDDAEGSPVALVDPNAITLSASQPSRDKTPGPWQTVASCASYSSSGTPNRLGTRPACPITTAR